MLYSDSMDNGSYNYVYLYSLGPKFRLRSRIARISTRKVKYARVDLRSFFDFIEAKMSDLEKRVSGLEAEQAQLGNKVNLLRGRVEAVENTYLDNRLQINLRKRVARQGA